MGKDENPKMLYFGPWDHPGHFFYDEYGRPLRRAHCIDCPWHEENVDGQMQPHRQGCNRRSYCGCGSLPEGQALLHYKDGWTALCFWDRSVDKRPACNSNYFAQGEFTFDEMVSMASSRFATRWQKMPFTVTLYGQS